MDVSWDTDVMMGIGNVLGYRRMNSNIRAALMRLGVKTDADCKLSIQVRSPDTYVPIPGKINVWSTMFESSGMPSLFIENIRKADALVVPSQFCADIFRPHVNTPIFVVPLGVDESLFTMVRRTPPKDRPFRWLWVGARNTRKGWNAISEVWEMDGPRGRMIDNPDLELYIKTVSDRLSIERYKNMFSDSRLIGDVEMVQIYHSAHAFVLPTMCEGFGLCVDPSTLLHTPQGVMPISEIQVGDQVLTRKGWRLVLGKIAHESQRLKIRAVGASVTVSPEHPFLSLPRRSCPRKYYDKHKDEQPQWVRADALRKGDFVAVPRPPWTNPLPEILDLAEWTRDRNVACDTQRIWMTHGFSSKTNGRLSIAVISQRYGVSKGVAENATRLATGRYTRRQRPRKNTQAQRLAVILREIDYTVPEPEQIPRFIPLDADLLKCLGWYLAEGDNLGSSGVSFSLGGHEQETADWLVAFFHKRFGLNAWMQHPTGKNVIRIAISSSILSSLFSQLCGIGAKYKKLHEILSRSATSLGPLLCGYIQGDGTRNRNSYGYRWHTASEQLAWQLRMILAAAGIHSRLNKTCRNGRDIWIGATSGDAAMRFEEWAGLRMDGLRPNRQPTQTALVREHELLVPIKSITSLNSSTVMDIEVEDTHEFIGDGFVLHNTALEAMSTALPCVLPLHTGLVEFANSQVCYPLRFGESKLIIDSPILQRGGKFLAQVFPVDPEDLYRQMWHVMDRYSQALIIGFFAKNRAAQFSWSQSALKLMEALRSLKDDQNTGIMAKAS